MPLRLRSRLRTVHHAVPEAQAILRVVREARSEFETLLASSCDPCKYPPHLSSVHSYDDVEVQALILVIPSLNAAKMRMKAFLTYATHWIDDLFDRFKFEPAIKEKIKSERLNLKSVLLILGCEFSEMFQSLFRYSVHPAAIEKGIHRLLYGGLINHADSLLEQQQYLREHADLFVNDLHPHLQMEISQKLDPLILSLTNKSAQEFWCACEDTYDPNVVALYSLLYTPALYFHDDEQERLEQELQFVDTPLPSVDELIIMIQFFRTMNDQYNDPRRTLRAKQLRILLEAFEGVLPAEISRAYRTVLSSLQKLSGQPPKSGQPR